MGRAAQADVDRRESIVFTALEKIGSKRVRRDLLADGSETSIAIAITASIGRAKYASEFNGKLFVAHKQTKASSSAPPTDHVVALLLEQLTEEQRAKILEKIASSFEKTGELPEVDSSTVSHAEAWLQRLRAKTTKTVAGAVTFQIADEK